MNNRYPPVERDERLVHDLLAQQPWPASVLSYELECHNDSTGDPALWVWLDVRDRELFRFPKRREEVRHFMSEVGRQALARGVSRWPYVNLREKG